MPLGVEGNRVRARCTLEPGESAYSALSWSEGLDGPTDVREAEARLEATVAYWRRWLAIKHSKSSSELLEAFGYMRRRVTLAFYPTRYQGVM
jgi:hypothetical protein